MKIQIKSSDRVFVTGQTGSGKSVLMKQLLIPALQNIVVYDFKEEIELPGAVYFHALSDFKKQPNENTIIYRPSMFGGDAEFDNLCRQVFLRGSNTLVLDEIASHMTPMKIMPWHDAIMRLGRSKKVGCINCTQRPCYTHNNVISQCEHFFIFELQQPSDKKKLADFVGQEIMQKIPKHWFWYYRTGMDKPILCPPLKLK